MDNVEKQKRDSHNEMVKIVKSKEAKKVIIKSIKEMEPKAFTDKGIIQSYRIDYNLIEHQDGGGINVIVYFNSDKELYENIEIDKNNGKLESGMWYGSPEIGNLIDRDE